MRQRPGKRQRELYKQTSGGKCYRDVANQYGTGAANAVAEIARQQYEKERRR